MAEAVTEVVRGVNVKEVMQTLEELIEKVEKGTATTEDYIQLTMKLYPVMSKARENLSKAVRSFWDSDEGELAKKLLSLAAKRSGYAKMVQDIMQGIRTKLEEAATQTKISMLYRAVWAKEE